MKISIIGAGYVGLTGACFANFDNEVVLIGRSQERADQINSGKSPIYEPGLDEIIKKNLEKKKLRATLDYKEIRNSDVVMLAVGTPSRDDGSIDLSQIESASKSLGEELKQTEKFITVVVKSTVIPGTTKDFIKPIIEKAS